MYRLHIDIALPFDEEKSKKVSLAIIEMFDLAKIAFFGLDQINYRLGHDEDRQKSNYFIVNESGHVNNKKSKILVAAQESPEQKV
jgi:hypothetical protein